MPKCSACAHPARDDIDTAILSGASVRDVAGQWNLAKSSIHRHRSKCLRRLLEAERQERAESLTERLANLERHALALLARAQAEESPSRSAGLLRESRELLALSARLTGRLTSEAVVVNVTGSAEWLDLRERILRTLADFPAARAALLVALENREGSADREHAHSLEA